MKAVTFIALLIVLVALTPMPLSGIAFLLTGAPALLVTVASVIVGIAWLLVSIFLAVRFMEWMRS